MIRKLLLWPLSVLLIGSLVYLLWALFAYKDLSTAELYASYGDDQLAHRDVNGSTVYYRSSGNKEGQIIVLVHSHYYDMGMWDAWVEQLNKNYRVLRYDLSSHGFSGPNSKSDYSIQADMATLLGLLKAQNIDRAHIVGSSLGGNIAFNFAAQFPQKTLSLTLINSGGIQQQAKAGREGSIPNWTNGVLRLLPTAAFQRFADWMIIDSSVDSDAVGQRMHRMLRHKGNRQAELTRMNQFQFRDNTAILEKIRAPVLIQWGAENPQLPASNAAEFKAMLTSAESVRTTLFENAGHALPLEQPLQSSQDFRNFLQQSRPKK